jgi:c-di-GMP-binding flagellar brake protein YcgR
VRVPTRSVEVALGGPLEAASLGGAGGGPGRAFLPQVAQEGMSDPAQGEVRPGPMLPPVPTPSTPRMFFKKRKPSPEPQSARRNLRSEYRRELSKANLFEATLRSGGFPPLRVELIDLSIRGAGARVPNSDDRKYEKGDKVQLAITGMMRSEIKAEARIASVTPDGGGHVRIGFEFEQPERVSQQLDTFYLKHFNRRRDQRVSPAIDRRVPATLRIDGTEFKGILGDIAESGVSVVFSLADGERLPKAESGEIEFRLPGCETYTLSACLRHRTNTRERVILGIEFDKDDERLHKHATELSAFILKRAAEMALWDKHGR